MLNNNLKNVKFVIFFDGIWTIILSIFYVLVSGFIPTQSNNSVQTVSKYFFDCFGIGLGGNQYIIPIIKKLKN